MQRRDLSRARRRLPAVSVRTKSSAARPAPQSGVQRRPTAPERQLCQPYGPARAAGDLVVAGDAAGSCSKPASAPISAAGRLGEMPGNPTRDMVRVVEQCTRRAAPSTAASPASPIGRTTGRKLERRALVARVGHLRHRRPQHEVRLSGRVPRDEPKTFTQQHVPAVPVNNGIPNQLTQRLDRFDRQITHEYDAFYAQEQWTLGRITLQGALRFDHAWSSFPEQQLGPARFLPTAIVFPEPRASSASTTSRRASAWPTTCSGTATPR